ncbi:MAG: minor capsid protein [Sarcina sp.]
MKNSEYWGRRLEAIIYKQEQRTVGEVEKELAKLYRSTQRKIKKRLDALYDEMLQGEGIKLSSLYEKKRLESINAQIKKELKVLGKAENKVVSEKLNEAYQLCYKEIAGEIGLEFTKLNTKAVEAIIHQAWSGEDFSDRIWANKDKLLKALDKGIKDTVILGYSKDKAIKEIMTKLDTSKFNSSRIVRTETMHTLNQACSNAAKERGYKRVEHLSELDERTCDVCHRLDGEIFSIGYSPLQHPMCRCTILPVVEDL